MKFYKRKSIDSHNPQDDNFAVEADGRLISDSTQSFKLPGGTVAQRPTNTTNGQIRHNTQLFDLETRVRTGWERIRTVRPARITVQNFEKGLLKLLSFTIKRKGVLIYTALPGIRKAAMPVW